MLNFLEQGQPRPDSTPLVIAHGLFGSARNWNVIAKRLAERGRIILPDLRNHGQSPHEASHSYADLAQDLARLIRAEVDGPVDLCGHSMGGKAAMVLALSEPQLVRRLVVADIAPTRYDHSQLPMIKAMRSVDLTAVTRRSEAAEQLAAAGVEPALQSFFTQSLELSEKRWLLNLDTLEAEMDRIMGWPDEPDGPFEGPTLFLSGGASDYVRREHRATIKGLFPQARFARIPGAGHWLHAEKPREFEAALRTFLDAT